MLSTPTTLISVLRGTTTNEYGDEVDTDDPLIQGEPASLIEKTRSVFDPVSGTPRVIVSFTCRVNPTLPIRDTDRILDESDNAVYAISSITKPRGPTVVADLRLDLVEVT